MAEIKNIDGLSLSDIHREVQRGGKFVTFPYCVSILVMTFKRGSSIYFIKSGETAIKYNWMFILISLFAGWWGIPWGPIYTIGSLFTNLTGGKDITQDVIAALQSSN